MRRELHESKLTSNFLGLALACSIAMSAIAKPDATAADPIRQLQLEAIQSNRSPVGHWGIDALNYKEWGTHSNRLIPIYTYGTAGGGSGVDLNDYLGTRSIYRSASRIRELYRSEPIGTLNPNAEYCDQTDITRLQEAALAAGRKHIFLVVFDGMDWQTTRAAAVYKSRSVSYESGRGRGLHFQDYTAEGTSQFGFMVTSPHNSGTEIDVDTQTVMNPNGTLGGGYCAELGGPTPWTEGRDSSYPLSMNSHSSIRHAYTDSSSSATSMNSGIKSFNGSINVGPDGRQFLTVAHQAQASGYSIGAVTSVPICHATPAATYAHNVSRDDYQDLTRDLVGLRSVSHPNQPLPGLDVLIGGGYGISAETNEQQGTNFVRGNIFLTEADGKAIDVRHGGKYVVAERTSGREGRDVINTAAKQATLGRHRLLGFFGAEKGHLPYATADGDHQPVRGRAKKEIYTPADLKENPTLADMTEAALTVLATNNKGFWLMVESGDVDWANHDNNLDNSIGAVLSGDAAVRVITKWVEQNSNWQQSVLIVTADHGHYLFLDRPCGLIHNRTPEPDGSSQP